ncbi:hypothetical protein TELCIR_23751, partial [Teladorsagia circumcincta]
MKLSAQAFPDITPCCRDCSKGIKLPPPLEHKVTICVISVDRYLAVTRPLRYKSLVTKTKSICFAGNEIRYLAHSVVFAFFLPAS